MPYVKVWVDDCEGGCVAAERLGEVARAALNMLRSGDQLGAIRALGEAVGDPRAKREKACELEVARLYSEWHALPQPRPEFLTFAHSRRKFTAA